MIERRDQPELHPPIRIAGYRLLLRNFHLESHRFISRPILLRDFPVIPSPEGSKPSFTILVSTLKKTLDFKT